jgi:hypothetical protein
VESHEGKFWDTAKNSILRLNEVVFVLIGSGGQIWEISAVAENLLTVPVC